MTIERFGSGGPWEDRVGYARVVRAGPHVHVAGCTGVRPDGSLAEGPGAQLRDAIAAVEAALATAGASLADVVRTRISVTDIGAWEEVADAHAEAFGDARPAAAMVEVSGLIDARMAVEIEVDAYSERPAG